MVQSFARVRFGDTGAICTQAHQRLRTPFFVFCDADFERGDKPLYNTDFYAQQRPGATVDPASNRWDSKGSGKADAKA